jgi:hypothetical protein
VLEVAIRVLEVPDRARRGHFSLTELDLLGQLAEYVTSAPWSSSTRS